MTVRYKHTEIRISFFFALAITVISLFDSSNRILLSMLSALLHESGHFISMVLLGEIPKKLEITPFGMRIERDLVNRMSFSQEMLIALAGPCVNFIFATFFFLIHMETFALINAVIGVFNMLPCEPLDGSKVLYYLIVPKLGEEKSDKILKCVSVVTIFPVAVIGFIVLIESGYNFSLLLIALYLCAFLVLKK